MRTIVLFLGILAGACPVLHAQDWWKPYSAPCTEREDVFSFKQKPSVKVVGKDRYEITFMVEGFCDVTVGLIDKEGIVVRHLASGVLGKNAPAPFQKDSLEQKIYWNGKSDLGTYVKEPGKLKVRVMLGLKPVFDKRLGGASPKNLPGRMWGVTAGETGVFVFTTGSRYYVRKFDHDGNYRMSLAPPPANLPESKLAGMGCVEYEPGKRALHFPNYINETVSVEGNFLPISGKQAAFCKPMVVGDRIFYATKLKVAYGSNRAWTLSHISTDGSTSLGGCRNRPLFPGGTSSVSLSLAASPDGRHIYFVEHPGQYATSNGVWRGELDSDKPGALFLGAKAPGSAEGQFNGTMDLDCDTKGRLYVCDGKNNRIQVFSPEGKFLKNISVSSPGTVAIHRKTGALYLLHSVRVQGKSTNRVTKLRSFDDPTPVAHADVPSGGMALDSWAPAPRVWLWGGYVPHTDRRQSWGLSIWEEDGKSFKKISDFDEEAKKEAGKNYVRWSGGIGDKVNCDPTREQVYFRKSVKFDLKTGALLGSVRLIADDIAFDKSGYVHLHFNPGFYKQGVARLDPERPGRGPDGVGYLECPYDYGVEKAPWVGVLPVRDQPGAKFFQDGVGVNMRGDVVVQTNIYYAPKFDDDSKAFMTSHINRDGGLPSVGGGDEGDGTFWRQVKEMQKRGIEVYSIRRKPGVPLIGGTIWTFAWNGELKQECAAITGDLMNGVQIDEDGRIYFVCDRQKSYGGKPFLAGRGGTYGVTGDKAARDPFTGTLLKSSGKDVRVLLPRAPTPMDEKPARAPEIAGPAGQAWVEGAEWFYAGASPIVNHSCSCPTMRHHTDWYKRSFVPEAYRHSIGVLDANGNLIMHLGRYGNFDSGSGPKSRIPVGGDNIAVTFVRFVSGTDNYLVFEDHSERLVVLKLNYHAEETVGIAAK